MLRKDLLNASGKELLEMLDYSEPGLLSLTAFMEIHSSQCLCFKCYILNISVLKFQKIIC